MPDGVAHRDAGALRDAEQREPVEPDRVDDGLEVSDPGLE
jgi:hypothetical protein